MALINVGDLFMDTVYADIIFVVDKKEIPGHRLVLAKTCDYFDKLLFGDFLESKSKKVHITGISTELFEEVMRFTYKRQLQVKEWIIEDLLSLLTVAHEYQFHALLSAVIEAVIEKPLDFDSWPLVRSAASVYDSEGLRRKCSSFAEEKSEDLIRGQHLEKFSADLICCMLDGPKMSSLNQDQVVKAICIWKKGQSSSDIMSVMQKINWENVSQRFTAIVLRELLPTVNKVEEHNFWTKLSPDIDGKSESNVLNDCISRVNSVALTKRVMMMIALPENNGTLFCVLESCRLVFSFQKDGSWFEIQVKSIEFEAETKFNIQRISGSNLQLITSDMVVSEPTSSNGWFKYSAVFSVTTPVYSMSIHAQHFKNMRGISLRNILIN